MIGNFAEVKMENLASISLKAEAELSRSEWSGGNLSVVGVSVACLVWVNNEHICYFSMIWEHDAAT